MAITVSSSTVRSGFLVNGTSADASGTEELVAAVTGSRIKVRSLVLNSVAALTVTIGAAENSGAVEAVLVGPVALAANSSVTFNFSPLLELPASKALVVDASGAGAICVVAQGEIGE